MTPCPLHFCFTPRRYSVNFCPHMSSSSSSSTSARLTAALEQQVIEISSLSRDAVLSGGWWYPRRLPSFPLVLEADNLQHISVQGIIYFISHASLAASILPVILKTLAAALGITLAMFTFTYLPQVAFCAIFSGPLAFATAALLVLGRGQSFRPQTLH
jgi:hypothetical protein